MVFESKWLDWQRETNPDGRNQGDSSVSSVSSLNKGNDQKQDSKHIKRSLLGMPYRQNSEKTLNPYIQRTDKTDKTPSGSRSLDGHLVSRVVWESDRAVVFADEHGRFWRYLPAYKRAWPVIVEGGKGISLMSGATNRHKQESLLFPEGSPKNY